VGDAVCLSGLILYPCVGEGQAVWGLGDPLIR
jgi:hypothetical protein